MNRKRKSHSEYNPDHKSYLYYIWPVTHNSDFIVCRGYRTKLCRKPLVSVLVQVDVNYKVSHWFQQTAFPEPHVKHRPATSVKSFGSPSTNPPTLIQPYLYKKPEWDIQITVGSLHPHTWFQKSILTVSGQPYSEEKYLIYTLKNKGSLLTYGSMKNIHETFPLHKRFSKVLVFFTLTNKWFF